jgi:hypothetical protein
MQIPEFQSSKVPEFQSSTAELWNLGTLEPWNLLLEEMAKARVDHLLSGGQIGIHVLPAQKREIREWLTATRALKTMVEVGEVDVLAP